MKDRRFENILVQVNESDQIERYSEEICRCMATVMK